MNHAPSPTNSLEPMAEEIFALTVMHWRQRVSRQHGDELSESQYLTIDILIHAPPRPDGAPGTFTVGEIQRAIGVLPAQMSRIIRSLETAFDKPLIRCELNQTDKRKIDVHLTADGRSVFDEFRHARLSKTVEILKNLADKDRQEFVRICGKIREVVSQSPQ